MYNTQNPELSDVIDEALRNFSNDLHTCTVGVIDKYDPVKHVANIKLGNKRLFEKLDPVYSPDGKSVIYEEVEVQTLLNVPVLFHSGGGIQLSFPLRRGDTCVVLFAEDDINNFRATGKPGTSPALINKFSWSSSLCIPAEVKNKTYSNNHDSEALVISSGGESDFVALAGLVKQGFEDLKTYIDGHTHAYASPGGPALTSAPSKSNAGVPVSLSPDAPDVASKKLKTE